MLYKLSRFVTSLHSDVVSKGQWYKMLLHIQNAHVFVISLLYLYASVHAFLSGAL